MQLRSSSALLALSVMLALPSAVQAQGRDIYLLPVPQARDMQAATGRAQPGVAASSPLGYGPSRGDVFTGVGYQHKSALGSADGAISAGMGFFNPQETVGLEVVLTSASTIRSGFGSRMMGALKVHKTLSNGMGLGLGYEGFKLWGDDFDVDASVYVAGTKQFQLRSAPTFSTATLNLGIGSGRFQAAEDVAAGESGMGVFFSAGIRMTSMTGLILDYTGGMTNFGFSFTPSATLPLVITPSFNDLSGEAGPGGRFALGVGFSWKY
jgi:hypothetical protein